VLAEIPHEFTQLLDLLTFKEVPDTSGTAIKYKGVNKNGLAPNCNVL